VPHAAPRALVLMRVPRGASPPPPTGVREALGADRKRLRLPPLDDGADYRIAGPYPVDVDGQRFDEYVAWEI